MITRYRNIRPIAVWLTGVVLAVSATTSFAEPTANLNAILSQVKSMSADFSQTTAGGAKNSNFSGSMSVQRPNKFRWHIKTPLEQLMVANGDTLWIYDKDLAQATRQSTANQVGDTPALLLSGSPEQIAQSFTIKQPNVGLNYFVLTPKSANSGFKSLSLSFNGGRPVMMVLNDNLGQTTTINFRNIKINPSINAAQFQFTPPKGVDIIAQ